MRGWGMPPSGYDTLSTICATNIYKTFFFNHIILIDKYSSVNYLKVICQGVVLEPQQTFKIESFVTTVNI